MSAKTKKKVTNLGKIIGTAVFALLFFLNIKIMLTDDLGGGDVSLLGLEIQLFDNTYATESDYKTGLTWCIGQYRNYYACLENASTYTCGGVTQPCQ